MRQKERREGFFWAVAQKYSQHHMSQRSSRHSRMAVCVWSGFVLRLALTPSFRFSSRALSAGTCADWGMISSDMKRSTKPNVGLEVIHWKGKKEHSNKKESNSRLDHPACAYHWCSTDQAASKIGGRHNKWWKMLTSNKIFSTLCFVLDPCGMHLSKYADQGTGAIISESVVSNRMIILLRGCHPEV